MRVSTIFKWLPETSPKVITSALFGINPVVSISNKVRSIDLTPCEKLECMSPLESAVDALMKMSRHNVGRFPVCENGKLVGIVTRSDLLHAIRIKTELRDK